MDGSQWVLSIVDEDAIVYAYNLRDFGLTELGTCWRSADHSAQTAEGIRAVTGKLVIDDFR